MYQILTAVGLLDNLDGKYHPVDVGNMSMSDIYTKYQRVYLTLTHTVVGGKYTLNMDKLPAEVKIQAYTLLQYLQAVGANSLPVEANVVNLAYKTVRSYNLWHAHFNFKAMNRAYHPDMVISWSQQTDLYMTKPEAHPVNLIKYGLFTVNGFVHMANTLADGVMIHSGAESARRGEDTQVGLLDFQHVGEIECIPITKDMLFKRNPQGSYRENVYIRVPKPMYGKTPLLVIGGFLHALDDLYSATSDVTIKFDFYKYSWLKRYNLAKKDLNLESLNVAVEANGATSYESLMSDEVIAEWFTLSQSFIVLVNTPELNVSTMEVEYSGLPGAYYTYSVPKYPLILGDGKIAEYTQVHQKKGYVLRTARYQQDNFAFELTDRATWEGSPMHRVSTEPTKPALARFLIISKTIEVPDGTDGN